MKEHKIIISCLTSAPGGIDRVVNNYIKYGGYEQFEIHLFCRESPHLFNDYSFPPNVFFYRYPIRSTLLMLAMDIKVIGRMIKLLKEGVVIINPHDNFSVYYSLVAKYLSARSIIVIPIVHQLAKRDLAI